MGEVILAEAGRNRWDDRCRWLDLESMLPCGVRGRSLEPGSQMVGDSFIDRPTDADLILFITISRWYDDKVREIR